MKSNFIIIISIFTLLCFLTIVSNFKLKESFIDQAYLTYDFNNGEFNLPLEKIKDINHKYPNISATALPLIVLKARYYINNDSIEEGIKLIKQEVNDNPYFNIRNVELANYYLRSNKTDSALYFSNLAFNNYPNAQTFQAQNFLLKSSKGLKSKLFETLEYIPLKTYNTYLNFIDSYLFELNDFDPRLDSLITYLVYKYPEVEKFNEYKIINLITKQNYYSSFEKFNEAQKSFENENYSNSLDLYCDAVELNPFLDKAYLNVIISLMKLNRDIEAYNLLKCYEDSKIDSEGEISYYLAVYELENKNNKKACSLLKKSQKRGYKNSDFLIKNFCQ